MFNNLGIRTILLLELMTCCVAEKIIETSKGPVKGKLVRIGRHQVYAFKNIPYAQQPVGKLRFEMPIESEAWVSTDDLPTDDVIACPHSSFQEEQDSPGRVGGQENCLYLDLYIRKHTTENSSLPVLVYFHGGRFRKGSKEEYGPDYFLRFNNIVLVIPNYRLGILGFLNYQDSTVSSNLGLWDQQAALKWVSQNIERFGGNADAVTIGGHEAGGVSVGLHVLARSSHEYFRSAISVSGTALISTMVITNPSMSTIYEIANAVNCSEESKVEIIECLKTTPLQSIMDVQNHISSDIILPSVDSNSRHHFIPEKPKVLYHKGCQKNVPYLVGYSRSKISYEISKEFPKVLKHQHLDKMISHFLKPYFNGTSNYDMIVKAAKYHYLRGRIIPTFESVELYILKMLTDYLYKSPAEQIMKFHSQNNDNAYMYIFKQKDRGTCTQEDRMCFGDEMYLFNRNFDRKTPEPDIEKIAETLSKIWGNFIKFKHPDRRRNWKAFGDKSNYADISDVIQPKNNHGSDDTEFWSNLVSDLIAAKNASNEHLENLPVPDYSTVGTWGAAGLAILCGVLCITLMGLVVITKRRTMTMSILPVSSPKEINCTSN